MKRSFFVVLTVIVLPFISKAKVLSLPNNNHIYINTPSVVVQRDTIIKDLEDLEAIIPEEDTESGDTVSYGTPAPKGYNGLRFVLDRRHRYVGDRFLGNSFWKHTYLNFGGGAASYLPNRDFSYTPFANLHLGFGKDFSPMSSVRLSFEGNLGFTKGSSTISSLTTYQSLGVNVDYLFNFTNYLLGYRPERPLNVLGVIGGGVQDAKLTATDQGNIANYTTTSAIGYGARFGLQFRLATSPHAFLAFEPFGRWYEI